MSEELKPCPFCGVVPELAIDLPSRCYVDCESDHCINTVMSREGTPEEAIAAWNTRAFPQGAAVDALREALSAKVGNYLMTKTSLEVEHIVEVEAMICEPNPMAELHSALGKSLTPSPLSRQP